MYKYIEPEVAGELGNETILDNTTHPPLVKKLHFLFQGWLGDDFIECFPIYIVTERLFNEIETSKLTGVIFDEVKVTTSDEFKSMYPHVQLPTFIWMKVIGETNNADFSIATDLRLLISEKALDVLRKFKIADAIISDFK